MPFVKPQNLQFLEGAKGASYIVTSLGLTLTLPENGGIKLPVELGILALPSDERPADLAPDVPYFNLKERPSLEIASTYVHLERLIAVCAQRGEEINRLFSRLNLIIFGSGIEGDNRLALQTIVSTIDFMTSKNIIIDYVKNSNLYKGFTSKEFRKGLDDFIVCRNIFTHGKLMLAVPPGNIFYIEHIDNHTKKDAFMNINVDIVKNYIQAAAEIKQFASDLEKEIAIKSHIITQGATCRIKAVV